MSTNFQDERSAVEALVKATIGTACPLFFENVFNTDEPRNLVWARCKIQPVSTRYAAIGITAATRMRRSIGFVYLQIYVPENKGTNAGLAIADIYADGVDSQVLTLTTGQMRLGVTVVKHEEAKSTNPKRDTGETFMLCVTDYQRDVYG